LEIAEPLDRVGGAYNAFTGEDYTGYFAKVDISHFDLALDIISDIYLNSKLDQKDIAKEKNVVIEEINMYHDHPMSDVQSLWTKLLYGDQPAGWDIAGTKESVLAIKRENLAEYMKNQYNSQNTIICVAGGISDNDKIVGKVKKYFSDIKTRDTFKKEKVVERQNHPEILLEQRKTDQTHFCLGTRGYNLFNHQRWAIELLGLVLGGMMSSRLFSTVREKMGLCYYIKTEVSLDPETGYLVTQAGVDNSKIEKAITAVLKEYKKLTQKKISPKELKKVKEHIKGRMTLSFENSDVLASFYGMQELLENKILTPEEIYDKINKVNVSDILKVAQDIFKPNKINLALIGPIEDKNNLWTILKKF